MNDIDLDACIRGSRPAWDAFVERSAPVIYAAVRRTLGGAVDVDDTVQDVYVRLVRKNFALLRSYDPSRAALTTWLTLIARSVAIDALRRRRLATVPLDAAPSPVSFPDLPREGGAGVPLDCLTARQRLVVRLLFGEQMTVPQAATVLGVDEQTIRSTKHKALVRLREQMTGPEGSESQAAGDAPRPTDVPLPEISP